MSREQKGGGSNRQFYQTFSGSFRTKVTEDHPEAVKRINKNGKQVIEREVRALFGFIKNIYFETSADYGESIKIELDENDEGKIPVLSFGVESKDGRDFLRKLPNINLDKEVRISAYRFIPEGQKEEISGITIDQQGEGENFDKKITNFFFDNEAKKYLHNHPVIDWDNATDARKKIYKVERDEFLKDYAKQHILPRFAANATRSATHETAPQNDTGDSFDQIPW